MKTNHLFKCVRALLLCVNISFSQDSVVAGNRIDLTVIPAVQSDQGGFVYSYDLMNGPNTEQEVYRFWVLAPKGVTISNLKAPEGWRVSFGPLGDSLSAEWGAWFNNVPPKSSLGGSFHAGSLPTIVPLYAEGWHPLPETEEEPLPGYYDLAPFGPGVAGKTVGPGLPLDGLQSLTLLDTLRAIMAEARTLGWIGTQAAEEKYIAYLDQARMRLQAGDSSGAKAPLEAMLESVPQDTVAGLTIEACLLLRLNTEYLPGTPPRKGKH